MTTLKGNDWQEKKKARSGELVVASLKGGQVLQMLVFLGWGGTKL